MRAAPAVARRAFVFLAVGVATACGTSPTQPSKIWSLAIGGVTSVSHPGETSQLTATANSSTSGVKKDVTTTTSWLWEGSQGVATVRGGLVTGIKYGRGQVRATYEGLSASVAVSVLPPGAFLLTGYVTEAGRPVIGVNVEVTSASGTLSTKSDNRGAYALPGAGPVTLRAELAGYETAVQSLTVEHDEEISVELRASGAYRAIHGVYTLTFTASPSCTLPVEFMQRTYTARIEDGRVYWLSDDLVVTVTGPNVISYGGQGAGFTGKLNGGAVAFTLRDADDWPAPAYSLVERVGNLEAYFVGLATGTLTEKRIETTFGGTVSVWPSDYRSPPTVCAAADHRLVFVR